MKIILATGNKNKISEIKEKFASIPELDIAALNELTEIPEIIEDADTFEGNALKKARVIRDLTGCAAMADDSGLVIDALNGEPGVKSARYAGPDASDEERYRLVLKKMTGIKDPDRTARFVCVIAVALPDGKEFTAEGTCEGMITYEPAGGNGFGYDPVFYIPAAGITMAEMTMDEKNRVSHRARALEKTARVLAGIING